MATAVPPSPTPVPRVVCPITFISRDKKFLTDKLCDGTVVKFMTFCPGTKDAIYYRIDGLTALQREQARELLKGSC